MAKVKFKVFTAVSGSVPVNGLDIAMLDWMMHGLDGSGVLRQVEESGHRIPVIVTSGYGNIEQAVAAMWLGAANYIVKPVSTDKVAALVGNMPLPAEPQEKFWGFSCMVGTSPVMQQVFALIQRVAETDSTVLITGETGTGKELAARALHRNSPRRDKPFLAILCAAVPEELMESELFGYERGAFTGAACRKLGAFEAMQGGTLFLDDITEAPLPVQAKFLRVLQEKEILRLGSTTTVQVDVRVLASTNKNPEQEVRAGRLREDLFYRLNVLRVHLPPLREREKDIPLLAQHFLAKLRKGMYPQALAPEVLEAMQHYRWPGNVRELENLIERVATLCQRETVTISDLRDHFFPLESLEEGEATGIKGAREHFERTYLAELLRRAGGNVTHAAKMAGIGRPNLQKMLRKYGLKRSGTIPSDFFSSSARKGWAS